MGTSTNDDRAIDTFASAGVLCAAQDVLPDAVAELVERLDLALGREATDELFAAARAALIKRRALRDRWGAYDRARADFEPNVEPPPPPPTKPADPPPPPPPPPPTDKAGA